MRVAGSHRHLNEDTMGELDETAAAGDVAVGHGEVMAGPFTAESQTVQPIERFSQEVQERLKCVSLSSQSDEESRYMLNEIFVRPAGTLIRPRKGAHGHRRLCSHSAAMDTLYQRLLITN